MTLSQPPESTVVPAIGLELLHQQLETAWINWRPGRPLPLWSDFLPGTDHDCTAEFVFLLLQTDIEFRVKAGLPALLAEPYFLHPRLKTPEARLEPARQVDLIRWEYRQGWKRGERVKRSAYLERFAEHAAALQDLRPLWNCPACKHTGIPLADESSSTAICPRCQSRHSLERLFPRVGTNAWGEQPDSGLDLRDYRLLEPLGHGGMGEVYRSRDPGLGRDLALKVLRADWQGHREVEQRFEEEARITASLQHPAIVPVHNLGRLRDGRLYFTMKVVRGETFADILAQRGEPSEQRETHLAVFAQVCQAVAYAHSKGVIHRDLKPSNVMVGRFGEVQVMDWGLAKILAPTGESEADTTAGASEVVSLRPTELQTHGALGTPEYMAPEQANGEWNRADERVDVFGLGGILCAILTGKPPYSGDSSGERLRKAQRGDLAEAFARLAGCGADEALVELAKECLHAEVAGRPRHAGVVAQRVKDHLAAVQECLRQAQLERAEAEARAAAEAKERQAAQARARAERRARQLLLVLAAAGLLLGLALWQVQRYRDRQDQAVQKLEKTLEVGRGLRDEGWKRHDQAILEKARIEADRAVEIGQTAGVSAALQQQAAAFQVEVKERLARWQNNQILLNALLEVTARETPAYQESKSGLIVGLVEKSPDKQYADAFWNWGQLVVDRMDEREVLGRLRDEPEPVIDGIVAGLDAWMMERLRTQPEASWRRLFRVAQQLDKDKQRRQLRELLVRVRPQSVAALVASPSWASLWNLVRGDGWRQLQALRRTIDPQSAPALTVVLLAEASSRVGAAQDAKRILSSALVRRPREVVLLRAMGDLLRRQGPVGLTEAIGCFRSMRSVRPDLGIRLARVLAGVGQMEEAEEILREMVRQQPHNPEMHFALGYLLNEQQKWPEGEAAYKEAIRLKPDIHNAHNSLGIALFRQGKWSEAIAAFKEAIRLDHDALLAHNNLGAALFQQGKLPEAAAAFKEAIRLKPNYPGAYNNLGNALADQGKLSEAIAAFKEALHLKPDYPEAHNSLGNALMKQDRWPDAGRAFKEAIRRKPNFPEAHNNLGNALSKQGRLPEAVASYKEAIRRKPNFPEAHNNLGIALLDQDKLSEAIVAFKEAIRIKPNCPGAHNNLGLALFRQGRLAEAVAAYKEAIRLNHDEYLTHFNLGLALAKQGKLSEAIAAFKEASRLKPDYPEAHNNLGIFLFKQGKLPEAVAAYQEAIRLQPDIPEPHHNLGLALAKQGKWPEATAAYRKAIQLNPHYPEAHYSLGLALAKQGKWPEAGAAHKEAIRLNPHDAEAHYHLGIALEKQGRLPEATVVYRKAIQFKHDFPDAHYNLGTALMKQGKWPEAGAAFKEAIRLKPDFPEGHCNLGQTLRVQGKFVESLAALRRGHELGVQKPSWHYPSALWVRQVRRLVELDSKLPALLQGDATPKNAAERIEFAQLCALKHLHATAARLYTGAFDQRPQLADNLVLQHRYHAARVAALAVAGKGKDAPRPDKEQVRLRQQALAWLCADLTVWSKALANANAQGKSVTAQHMRHWQSAPDLAGVRDRDALAKLPEDERKQWQKLWANVDALLKKASAG